MNQKHCLDEILFCETIITHYQGMYRRKHCSPKSTHMANQSSLQVNCGLTGAELHLLLQGSEKLIAECHTHTCHLANVPKGSIDDNLASILEYYSKRMNQIRALQTRLQRCQEELARKKQFSVGHNLEA
jgi:hypothetical protein